MAAIVQIPKIEVSATFALNESELRALDALVGYGVDGFLKVFYEKMGRHYLEPHEAGLRTLFESVRSAVPAILGRTDDARRVFTGERVAVHADMPQRLANAGSKIAELNAQLGEAQATIAASESQQAGAADNSKESKQ